MKSVCSCIAIAVFLSVPAGANAQESLAFLKGCWQAPDGQNGQDTRVETWADGAGGGLVGSVKTAVLPGEDDGDNFAEEIQTPSGGPVVYTATMPEPGNPKNVFVLTSASAAPLVKAIFNMTASYSDKIKALVVTYSSRSSDELSVAFDVTLADGTQVPTYGYTYKRISCGGN